MGAALQEVQRELQRAMAPVVMVLAAPEAEAAAAKNGLSLAELLRPFGSAALRQLNGSVGGELPWVDALAGWDGAKPKPASRHRQLMFTHPLLGCSAEQHVSVAPAQPQACPHPFPARPQCRCARRQSTLCACTRGACASTPPPPCSSPPPPPPTNIWRACWRGRRRGRPPQMCPTLQSWRAVQVRGRAAVLALLSGWLACAAGLAAASEQCSSTTVLPRANHW